MLHLHLPEISISVHQNEEVKMEIKHTKSSDLPEMNSLKKQATYLLNTVAIISCVILAKLRNTQS